MGAAISALGSLCTVYRAFPVVVAAPNGTGNTPGNGDATQTTTSTLLDEHWKDLIFRVTFSLPRLTWTPVQETIDFFEGVVRGLMASIVYSPSTNVPVDPRPARAALPERLAELTSVSVQCLSKVSAICGFVFNIP